MKVKTILYILSDFIFFEHLLIFTVQSNIFEDAALSVPQKQNTNI